MSQGGDCREIASNFNCDLKSQLGFLVEIGKINLDFLGVEGMTIPWWRRKVYSLVWMERLFLGVEGKFIPC